MLTNKWTCLKLSHGSLVTLSSLPPPISLLCSFFSFFPPCSLSYSVSVIIVFALCYIQGLHFTMQLKKERSKLLNSWWKTGHFCQLIWTTPGSIRRSIIALVWNGLTMRWGVSNKRIHHPLRPLAVLRISGHFSSHFLYFAAVMSF